MDPSTDRLHGAVLFPPCEWAHGHIPLHATAASNGIKPGLSGAGTVAEAAERYVVPPKVENLRRKQELDAVGCLNTAVGAALCWMAGVNRDLWEGKLGSGLGFFKIRCRACNMVV